MTAGSVIENLSMPEFKIYKSAIPENLIDNVLNEHTKFKTGRNSVFRAQGTTNFEKPQLDEFGNQINSIHNPHLNGLNVGFSKSIQQIIFSEEISNCLEDFTSNKQHVHYQSMFFDKSTGTGLHQDTWYLDTSPPGHLVGVWVALENISKECGPFYLYKNSPTEKASPESYRFTEEDQCAECEKKYPDLKRFDFMPNKGDILIWNSLVLHGAHKPSNKNSSRKSITSHYYPKGFGVQNAPTKRIMSIYDHQRPKLTFNSNIFQATTINPLLFGMICQALFRLGNIGKIFTNELNPNTNLTEIRRLDDA